MASRTPQFHAPVFLGTAFFVMGLALLEKVLNVFGGSIPFVDVFPRQLIDWAVALLMFEIALSVRQMIELKLDDRQGSMPQSGQKLH
jgi:hypothetical protein